MKIVLATSSVLLAALVYPVVSLAQTLDAPEDPYIPMNFSASVDLGIGFSGDYETVDGQVVVDEGSTLTLGVNADVSTIVVPAGASLELGVNSTVTTIRLEDAGSLTTTTNSTIGSITGTVQDLTLGVNSTISLLLVTVSGTTDIGVNTTIEEIYLKTDALKSSVNVDIQTGNVYVYGDLKGGVNGSFSGKLTTYWSTDLSVNEDVAGRFCALGPVALGVNSEVRAYGFQGFLGNIDPVLDVTITDYSDEFATVSEQAKSFDAEFFGGFDDLAKADATITGLKSKLAAATDDEAKVAITASISAAVSDKAGIKTAMKTLVENTFTDVEQYVDENEQSKNLFARIRAMYVYAVETENRNQVYNVCNNAEVTGSVNSVYSRNGKIYVGNRAIDRVAVLSQSESEFVAKKLAKLSDEKLAKMQAKIDGLEERIGGKKTLSKSDERILNLLADVEEAVRSEMLYSD